MVTARSLYATRSKMQLSFLLLFQQIFYCQLVTAQLWSKSLHQYWKAIFAIMFLVFTSFFCKFARFTFHLYFQTISQDVCSEILSVEEHFSAVALCTLNRFDSTGISMFHCIFVSISAILLTFTFEIELLQGVQLESWQIPIYKVNLTIGTGFVLGNPRGDTYFTKKVLASPARSWFINYIRTNTANEWVFACACTVMS